MEVAAVFVMAWGTVFLTETQLVFLGLEERVGCFWCCRKLFGDFIKIKMKTGSMAYVMEHRLYGLFFA